MTTAVSQQNTRLTIESAILPPPLQVFVKLGVSTEFVLNSRFDPRRILVHWNC
jgi:hypothetical protein